MDISAGLGPQNLMAGDTPISMELVNQAQTDPDAAGELNQALEGQSPEDVQQLMLDMIGYKVLMPLWMQTAYKESLEMLNINEKGEMQV